VACPGQIEQTVSAEAGGGQGYQGAAEGERLLTVMPFLPFFRVARAVSCSREP